VVSATRRKEVTMPGTIEFQQGVDLSKLSPGSVCHVETKNRRYRIEYLGGDQIRISGHPRICPTPTLAELRGSTSDSGAFERGVLGRGRRLEFRPHDEHIPITTSVIVDIRVEYAPSTESSVAVNRLAAANHQSGCTPADAVTPACNVRLSVKEDQPSRIRQRVCALWNFVSLGRWVARRG
jgi:hypothetical protein